MCDNTYGFSIGRGAFNFTAGDWTHLRQNVVLNTPGKNDGMFMLFVDGRPKINRTDVIYRNVAQQAKVGNSVPKVAGNKSEDKSISQPAEFIGPFFRYCSLQRSSDIILTFPRAHSLEGMARNTPRRKNNTPGSKILQSPGTIDGQGGNNSGRVHTRHYEY